MSDQLFSKEEISEILKKASEIQTQKDLYGDKEGLSKDELVTLAKEVGIDKDSLFEAIAKKNVPEFENHFNWLKGTVTVQDVQLVEGEITQEHWDQVVLEIRKATGGIGESSIQGNSFEWIQRFKDIGTRHISFTPENGRTKIQYVHKWLGIKFMSGFFGFMFAFGFAVVSLEDSTILPKAISLLLALGVGGLGSFVNRFFLKSYFEKKKKTMHRVMTGIRTELSKTNTPGISIEGQDVYSAEEFSQGNSKTSSGS